MASPTSAVEDGPIQPFRGPNINTTNPVIIVRIPDALHKHGEPRYQLATNPLSTEKVTSDLPTTLLLKSMLPNAERNTDHSSPQPIRENISPELNIGAGELDVNENLQISRAPKGRLLAQDTYSQGIVEDGGFRASYSTSPSANFMEPQSPSPWIDIPFSFQQRMPPLEQPLLKSPLFPYPPPCNFARPPLLMNSDFRPHFEPQRDFSPNRNQGMQRPFVRQQLDCDQDFNSQSGHTSRHRGRRNFRGNNRFFKKTSQGYRGYH